MKFRMNVVSIAVTCLMVCVVWTSGTDEALAALQGYWNFDETSGTTAFDSAKSNDGTLLGTNLPVRVGGHTGEAGDSALDFLGNLGAVATKSHVLIPNSPDLQIIGDQTISMWLRPLSRVGAGGYGAIGSGTVGFGRQNPWHKHYNNEGTWTVEPGGTINYYYGDGVTIARGSGAAGKPVTSSWDLFTVVRDLNGSGTGTVKWYKNGLLTSTGVASKDPALASAFNLEIGAGYTTTFDGEIDDAAVWDETLSVPEIASMYQLSTDSTNILRNYGFQIDELDQLWAIYDGGPGSTGVVNDLIFSYVEGVDTTGHVLGSAWTPDPLHGFLLLDVGNGSGVQFAFPVPEPSSFLLLSLGALGLVRHTRRRRQRA